MKALLIITIGLFSITSSLPAADPVLPKTIPLWLNGTPDSDGTTSQETPTLTYYEVSPRSINHCAVVVCPGGGYGGHAIGHEGTEIAGWLNSFGVTAFILKYRLGMQNPHPAPLEDAQQAIRYVRANAQKYDLNPDTIGILGFSAGGHLASTAATHFDHGTPDSQDPIQQVSCRPDFAILCYPVISMQAGITHKGSRMNLLGKNPDEKLVQTLSNESMVTKETPPTFLFHTQEDAAVLPINSLLFYQAMLNHGVPGELHIYQKGAHGVGLATRQTATSTWPELAERWMAANGWTSTKQ